jgi:hypothetical protein
MFFIFAFLSISSLAQEPPSAKQVCLEDALALESMIGSSQCQWPKTPVKNPQIYACEGVLFDCLTKGEMNVKFAVCTKKELLAEGSVSEEVKKTHISDRKQLCQSPRLGVKKCIYNSVSGGGRAAGDDPTITDEDCRVPLKQNFQGIQQ